MRTKRGLQVFAAHLERHARRESAETVKCCFTELPSGLANGRTLHEQPQVKYLTVCKTYVYTVTLRSCESGVW